MKFWQQRTVGRPLLAVPAGMVALGLTMEEVVGTVIVAEEVDTGDALPVAETVLETTGVVVVVIGVSAGGAGLVVEMIGVGDGAAGVAKTKGQYTILLVPISLVLRLTG